MVISRTSLDCLLCVILIVEMSSQLTYLYYNLHSLLHNLYAHKLVRAMEVASASEDIRTRQTLERQLCAVCTATYRLHLRSNAVVLHGLKHDVYHVHVGVYLLLHVVVLILQFYSYGSFAPLLVHLLYAILDKVLAVMLPSRSTS